MAAFTVIDHTELSGSATTWTKSSIPSSYDHLYLEFSARSDDSSYRDEVEVNLNADTGNNYSLTQLFGVSGTPGSQRSSGIAKIDKNYLPAASSTADTFGTGTLWIPHYSNTANFKQVLIQAAGEGATTTDYQWGISVCAGLWSSTAAVNQITLGPLTGTNFVQYSTFTLYGVTGA
jgi:hypothetical protein